MPSLPRRRSHVSQRDGSPSISQSETGPGRTVMLRMEMIFVKYMLYMCVRPSISRTGPDVVAVCLFIHVYMKKRFVR